MGWLAAQGAIMAIGLFIGLVCSVIGLFFGHIINDNRSIGAFFRDRRDRWCMVVVSSCREMLG